MWDLYDEQGNFYRTLEDISKDFYEVNMKPNEQAVVREMMTSNKLDIGYACELGATTLNIPILDENIFGKTTYWKLSRLCVSSDGEHYRWEKMTEKNCIQEGKEYATNNTKLDISRLKLVYSPSKNRIFLTGFNQSNDYRYRLQQRANAIDKIPMSSVLSPKKSESQMGFGEKLEAQQKILKNLTDVYDTTDYYSFAGCRLACTEGNYIGKGGVFTPCPDCRNKRRDFALKGTKGQTSKLTIKEHLNIPAAIAMPTEQVRQHPTYKQLMEILNTDVVVLDGFRGLNVFYCGLLELYVEKPQIGGFNFRITPVYTPTEAKLNEKTKEVLVIMSDNRGRDKELIESILAKRENLQQEYAIGFQKRQQIFPVEKRHEPMKQYRTIIYYEE